MSDLNFVLQLAGPHALEFVPITPKLALRVSDQGIRMIAQVVDGDGQAVNIRGASTKTLKLMRPDGTTYDAASALFSNGADGKMYFTSSASVPPFSQVGEWWMQAKVIIAGVAQSTKWANFAVEANIDAT